MWTENLYMGSIQNKLYFKSHPI